MRPRTFNLPRIYGRLRYSCSSSNSIGMSLQYICSTCRQKLLASSISRTNHSKASFVSIAKSARTERKSTRKDYLGLADAPASASLLQNTLRLPTSRRKPPATRRPDDLLESLFEDGLRPGSAVSSDIANATDMLKLNEHILELQRLASGTSEELDNAWIYFKEHLSPKAMSYKQIKSLEQVSNYKKVINRMFINLLSRQSSQTPAFFEILVTQFICGLWNASTWRQATESLLNQLYQADSLSIADERRLIMDLLGCWRVALLCWNIPRVPRFSRFLYDQHRDWDFLSMLPTLPRNRPEAANSQWIDVRLSARLNGNLHLLKTSQRCTAMAKYMAICAVKTVDRVQVHLQQYGADESLRTHPLIQIFAAVMVESPRAATQLQLLVQNQQSQDSAIDWPNIVEATRSTYLETMNPLLTTVGRNALTLDEPSPERRYGKDQAAVSAQTSARIMPIGVSASSQPAVVVETMAVSKHRQTEQNTGANVSLGLESNDHDAQDTLSVRPAAYIRKVDGKSSVHDRLKLALLARNLAQMCQLWEEAMRYPVIPPSDKYDTGTKAQVLSHPLCHHFIKAFVTIRQPQKAVDVWNHMTAVSLEPNGATWNSMLEGCRVSRDANALENVWNKLITSGSKPDVVCWTTRISGLLDCGKTREAMIALAEMGKTWISAARKVRPAGDITDLAEVDGYVKPTVANINATLSGLSRRNREVEMQSVLRWAGSLGIAPDTFTYNILLRPLVKAGQSDAAIALLEQMRDRAIPADQGTFTIIIDGTLRANDDLTPMQQKQAVDHIFTVLKAADMEPGMFIFAKMIDSLLRQTEADMSVVQSLLERMAEEGLKPNSHIFTSLIIYHFSRTPPDFEAIGFLIDRINHSSYFVDHIFWDRVIEGYAHAGDTGRALTIFGRHDREGKRVGWYTSRLLLQALSDNEEWDLARQFVGDIRRDRGDAPDRSVRGVDGQHDFWALAEQLRLTGQERPDQAAPSELAAESL